MIMRWEPLAWDPSRKGIRCPDPQVGLNYCAYYDFDGETVFILSLDQGGHIRGFAVKASARDVEKIVKEIWFS
jgi:hypothetical protein